MGVVDVLGRVYTYMNDEISDPRTANYPMIGSPIPIFIIFFVYMMVISYGPVLMEYRRPFQIDRIVIVYNVFQIIFSGCLFVSALLSCYIPLRYNLICEPVGTSTAPIDLHVTFLCWCYFLIKIYDLLDTVFIILRKKSTQLSFLHIYHHSGMIIAAYAGVKYLPGGQSMLLGTINCFVHVVMYTYYLLTVIKPELKSSWWKRHITQLQLGQFAIVFVHLMLAVLNPYCSYPSAPVLLAIGGLLLLVLLFKRFYHKEYVVKDKKQL